MSNPREQKALVVLAIEHTLLKISSSTLGQVESRLHEQYNCALSDCYEHPEYLATILKELFGVSYSKVLGDISVYLSEFTYQRPIAEFLQKMI